MGIRIDALDAGLATRDHEIPAMKDGATVKLTAGQILDLIIGSAPGALDTLEELAAALADDENFAATITNALALKASLTGAETLSNKILTAPIVNSPIGEFLRGHLSGLTLSNNGSDANNDIDIAAGSAASDGTTPVLMTLSSAITKRLDAAWAVGTGNGGLDTGSKANSTWYYRYLIQRSDTGVTDILLSASPTGPTMPANYDRKVRLPGAIRTDSSGNIIAFKQYPGRRFIYATPSADINTTIGTSASTHPILVPPIQVASIVNLRVSFAGAFTAIYFSGPDQADAAPASVTMASLHTDNIAGGSNTAAQFVIDTATALIRARSSSAGTTLTGQTLGFVDNG